MSSHHAPHPIIPKYSFPRGPRGLLILVFASLMIFSVRRENIEPGSMIHDEIQARLGDNGVKLLRPVQDTFFYCLYGLHTMEMAFIAIFRLPKFHVNVLSWLWLQWILTTLVGGIIVSGHFEEVVNQQHMEIAGDDMDEQLKIPV